MCICECVRVCGGGKCVCVSCYIVLRSLSFSYKIKLFILNQHRITFFNVLCRDELKKILSGKLHDDDKTENCIMKNTRDQMLDVKKECDQLECSRRNLEEQHRYLQVTIITLFTLFHSILFCFV